MRRLTIVMAVAVAAIVVAVAASGVGAAPTFTPFDQASIHPGVVTTTGSARCTSNFLFTDDSGALYLGQAAHCSETQQGVDGCKAGSLPLGTNVTVSGASRPGTLAYNSWLTMQKSGETDPNICANNDFALVKIDPADAAKVNPSVPFFGGPVGMADQESFGDAVFSYGNSPLRQGLTVLNPKFGTSLGQNAGGWLHTVLTVTPGVPGDSGSGYEDAQGRAFGVLSTLDFLPAPLTNGVGDLSRMLAYANQKAGLGVRLVPGTMPFNRSLLRLGI